MLPQSLIFFIIFSFLGNIPTEVKIIIIITGGFMGSCFIPHKVGRLKSWRPLSSMPTRRRHQWTVNCRMQKLHCVAMREATELSGTKYVVISCIRKIGFRHNIFFSFFFVGQCRVWWSFYDILRNYSALLLVVCEHTHTCTHAHTNHCYQDATARWPDRNPRRNNKLTIYMSANHITKQISTADFGHSASRRCAKTERNKI